MLAIVNIGTKEAYDIIDRERMKKFLLSVKNNNFYMEEGGKDNKWIHKDKEGHLIMPKGASQVLATLPGSIEIHRNGEMDMRALYCAIVVADILDILEGNEDLSKGIGDFITSC